MFLIKEGVPEPVAAAESLALRGAPLRRGFLVIDIGAGTTDFGLFIMVNRADLPGLEPSRSVARSTASVRLATRSTTSFALLY